MDIFVLKRSRVMSQLYGLFVLKRDRAVCNSKAFCFQIDLVSILTYGHVYWEINERVRFQLWAVKKGFLQKIRGLSLLDKVKSTDIFQSLNIKPLLLGIKRSQLCWYVHATRMFYEQTAKR